MSEKDLIPEAVESLFEARARRGGDAVAVIDPEGAHLTYRQLDRRANRLA